MRIFTGITSWFAWLSCLYIWAAGTLVVTMNTAEFPPDANGLIPTYVHAIMLVILGSLAVITYALRYQFWFSRNQAVGFGYWSVTSLFYFFTVLFLTANLVPYFSSGRRDAFLWTGLLFGSPLLVLGFPRLPSKEASPPPIDSAGIPSSL